MCFSGWSRKLRLPRYVTAGGRDRPTVRMFAANSSSSPATILFIVNFSFFACSNSLSSVLQSFSYFLLPSRNVKRFSFLSALRWSKPKGPEGGARHSASSPQLLAVLKDFCVLQEAFWQHQQP